MRRYFIFSLTIISFFLVMQCQPPIAIPPTSNGPPGTYIPYDEPPYPLTPIRPKYPLFAMNGGVEGTVIVEVFVDKNGRVTETSIMKGIRHSSLNGAAIKAIKSTKFKPAKQKGEPVGVWISIPISFRLK
ncbi:MAG: energy transducer TonB [Candidatus Marinimicrobia bacterium]|nr:energy transducer TonB [Candidatus Neomarinimicrobiota bacterium]